MIKIGIIGGSGLDDPKFSLLEHPEKTSVSTPYGEPSSPVITGEISGTRALILARHGKDHQLSPTQVNYRANIHALKELGATHIIATTACGSLKTEINRGDFVIVDQFIDFTRFRKTTFFESFENGARHTPMAEPFDKGLRSVLLDCARELSYPVHDGGCVVTIEGPRFSTKAESNMFRIWGGHVINMSVAPEAALANEAEIPYAAVAMSTDYDCWKDDEAPVSWEEIVAVFNQNADRVINLLAMAIPRVTAASV